MDWYMNMFERNWEKYICFSDVKDVEEIFSRIANLEKQVADLHELLTK